MQHDVVVQVQYKKSRAVGVEPNLHALLKITGCNFVVEHSHDNNSYQGCHDQ